MRVEMDGFETTFQWQLNPIVHRHTRKQRLPHLAIWTSDLREDAHDRADQMKESHLDLVFNWMKMTSAWSLVGQHYFFFKWIVSRLWWTVGAIGGQRRSDLVGALASAAGLLRLLSQHSRAKLKVTRFGGVSGSIYRQTPHPPSLPVRRTETNHSCFEDVSS